MTSNTGGIINGFTATSTTASSSCSACAFRTSTYSANRFNTFNDFFVSGVSISPCLNSKDRKSTRLNSSHVRISYAVFCLKKKTNNDESGAKHLFAIMYASGLFVDESVMVDIVEDINLAV